ncbi:SIR2 family protein [Providencia rettgeri]|nr:SIR2 family protein [Providencia rettgeri]ELR5126819.1 SIR2 family protein [Providencia rettgeri]ELR5243350.1 SIR2 family protein [Providencia rettgeri]ELR5257736.1 SIR2 family protein [Providencia rettgeri]ELS4585010.1 SIR2 family protein [Providencia rettgeri]
MIDRIVKELEESNFAIFAGAGLSSPAGYLNWKDLLRPLSDELNLDINKETDLVSLAQYYVNENSRNRLTERLIDEIAIARDPTINHKLLAKLPIFTYWTTNYDDLIEKSLDNENKLVDKKFTINHLSQTKKGRSAIVYKMHGDASLPEQAILTKDQYESYSLNFSPFITALSGDLVSKTFLFLGFSFTDPNLDYILSRIRINFEQNQRQHYCIFRKVSRSDYDSDEEFSYSELKQNFVIKDLSRFSIKVVLIENWKNLTDILEEITKRFRCKNVFLSGSAHEFGSWDQSSTEIFLSKLGEILIRDGFKITSGLGLGIGNAFISGAIKEIYTQKYAKIDDYLTMKVFPQFVEDPIERKKIWSLWREDLLNQTGIAFFFMGNKVVHDSNTDSHTISLADGMDEEFNIAKRLGLKLIPIGASGYKAKELYDRIISDFDDYYPNYSPKFREAFEKLGEEVDEPNKLLEKIHTVIKLI